MASAPALASSDLAPAALAACDAGHAVVFSPASQPALPARALWLDRGRLRWPGADPAGHYVLASSRGGEAIRVGDRVVDGRIHSVHPLRIDPVPLPDDLARRFAWAGTGPVLALDGAVRDSAPLLTGDVSVLRLDAGGRVLEATATQVPGALDDAYAAAVDSPPLGAVVGDSDTTFRLWAPTATAVALCLHDGDHAAARAVVALERDAATGIWSTTRTDAPSGAYYTYLVDLFVPGVGRVRNRVTDPYSASLGADSKRSMVVDFADPALAPAGWADDRAPRAIAANTDLAVYELHVRDFSIGDASVPEAHRGKYPAFADPGTVGTRQLRALAAAGITDVHLLPVFDLATVPESGCATPAISADGRGDRGEPAAAMAASAAGDCFNWGYDPLHFNAPEGSYATDASDGAVRIREFRTMVAALHRAGLRVGMDVVYNHMSASGQDPRSVLDRIVPGYYHRLDGDGAVTRSTCCANTATEHAMMQRLMLDSAEHWVRHYHVDSFRFDLMGHQPRAAMEALQARVDAAAGRRVPLLGEGWNFGEVADGVRFVQASQLSLAGAGIGTFSDRARDAVRGGGPADSGAALFVANSWAAGFGPGVDAAQAANAADLVRVGLAGSLRDYRLADGRTLAQVDYKGQPGGYVTQPGEVVNYVENHDNQTLFDLLALKLPAATSPRERARVQLLAAATTALAQGIAYFHAGLEVLRSKSLDRNSYDSGDWFNRLDYTGADNGWARGLPPKNDNGRDWPLLAPRLADPRIRAGADDVAFMRDAFLDLLRIRAGSTLFRLRTADEVQLRLAFPATPDPRVIAGHLDGRGLAGAGFAQVLYFLNSDDEARRVPVAFAKGQPWVLHPVHRAGADARAREAAFAAATGTFTVPPRTAVVFVVE